MRAPVGFEEEEWEVRTLAANPSPGRHSHSCVPQIFRCPQSSGTKDFSNLEFIEAN